MLAVSYIGLATLRYRWRWCLFSSAFDGLELYLSSSARHSTESLGLEPKTPVVIHLPSSFRFGIRHWLMLDISYNKAILSDFAYLLVVPVGVVAVSRFVHHSLDFND